MKNRFALALIGFLLTFSANSAPAGSSASSCRNPHAGKTPKFLSGWFSPSSGDKLFNIQHRTPSQKSTFLAKLKKSQKDVTIVLESRTFGGQDVLGRELPENYERHSVTLFPGKITKIRRDGQIEGQFAVYNRKFNNGIRGGQAMGHRMTRSAPIEKITYIVVLGRSRDD